MKTFIRKEVYCLAELEARLPDLKTVEAPTCDSVIGGCSNKRPDMFFDFGTGVLCIEIDEHQHKDRDPTCERSRLEQLFEDVACRPMHVIRFNPDEYRDRDGDRRGMFVYTRVATGERRLKADPMEFGRRMGVLEQCVRNYFESVARDTPLEGIQYLFYDEL